MSNDLVTRLREGAVSTEQNEDASREAADELGALFTQTCPVRLAGDMDAAVNLAVELAPSGSTILLSPACASLDMFVDYTHRGDAFITSVKGLAP